MSLTREPVTPSKLLLGELPFIVFVLPDWEHWAFIAFGSNSMFVGERWLSEKTGTWGGRGSRCWQGEKYFNFSFLHWFNVLFSALDFKSDVLFTWKKKSWNLSGVHVSGLVLLRIPWSYLHNSTTDGWVRVRTLIHSAPLMLWWFTGNCFKPLPLNPGVWHLGCWYIPVIQENVHVCTTAICLCEFILFLSGHG